MKKIGYILGIAIVIGVFIFVNKSYYPSLPLENLSAKEVIKRLEESDHKIVEIAAEEDSIWYITRSDISIADEDIKQMIGSNGWEFKEKDGAGLFFEKTEKD